MWVQARGRGRGSARRGGRRRPGRSRSHDGVGLTRADRKRRAHHSAAQPASSAAGSAPGEGRRPGAPGAGGGPSRSKPRTGTASSGSWSSTKRMAAVPGEVGRCPVRARRSGRWPGRGRRRRRRSPRRGSGRPRAGPAGRTARPCRPGRCGRGWPGSCPPSWPRRRGWSWPRPSGPRGRRRRRGPAPGRASSPTAASVTAETLRRNLSHCNDPRLELCAPDIGIDVRRTKSGGQVVGRRMPARRLSRTSRRTWVGVGRGPRTRRPSGTTGRCGPGSRRRRRGRCPAPGRRLSSWGRRWSRTAACTSGALWLRCGSSRSGSVSTTFWSTAWSAIRARPRMIPCSSRVGRSRMPSQLADQCDEVAGHLPGHRLGGQLLLAPGEVAVDRRPPHAGPPGHALHAQPAQPHLARLGDGGGEDPRSGRRRRPPGARSRAVASRRGSPAAGSSSGSGSSRPGASSGWRRPRSRAARRRISG